MGYQFNIPDTKISTGEIMSRDLKAENKAADRAAKEDRAAAKKKGDGARAMIANKIYTRQLPEVLPENYNEAQTQLDLHGNKKCYDCCTDKSGCCSPGCTVCLIGVGALCCLLCCYTTDGFNGVWTYWPN